MVYSYFFTIMVIFGFCYLVGLSTSKDDSGQTSNGEIQNNQFADYEARLNELAAENADLRFRIKELEKKLQEVN